MESTTTISVYRLETLEIFKQISITTLHQETDLDEQHRLDVEHYVDDVLQDKYDWDEYESCYDCRCDLDECIMSIHEDMPFVSAVTEYDYYTYKNGVTIY